MKVRVVQITKGSKSEFRGKPIIGHAQYAPKVGCVFTVYYGEGNTMRCMSTSTIIRMLDDGKFLTHSGSIYQVKIVKSEWN